MNRRQFLQALAYVGATGALAIELVEQELALPPRPLVIEHAYDDVVWLQEFAVYTCEEVSRAVNFGLRRAGSITTLIHHSLNAQGAWLKWTALPGGEIAMLPRHQLDIIHDFDGACEMVTRMGNQIRSDHFILRRPLPGSPDELIERRSSHVLRMLT